MMDGCYCATSSSSLYYTATSFHDGFLAESFFFFSSLIHLWVILSLVCDWAYNFFIHTTILWYRSTILLVSVFTLILYIEYISKHITTQWLWDHGYIERKVVIVLLANHEISVFTLILCIEHISKHITTRWLRDHGLYREEGSNCFTHRPRNINNIYNIGKRITSVVSCSNSFKTI